MSSRSLVAFCAAVALLPQAVKAAEVDTSPPPGIVPTSTTLEHVLWANRRAEGNSALGVSPTRREAWKLTFGAMTGTITYVSQGRDYREDQTLGPNHTVAGRSGGTTWQIDANGQLSVGSDLHRGDEIDDLALEATHHTGVTLLGDVATPVRAYVVKVDPAGGRLEYRFYDQTTFLLDRIEEIRGSRRLMLTFDDYRTTQGQTNAWHAHSSDGFATNDSDRILQTLQIGAPVSAAETEMPSARTALIAEASLPAQIPVALSGDMFVVPVKMGPHTVNFILDSGADGIVVDSGVVEALGIKEYGRITSETAGTYVESDIVIPAMTIGPLTLSQVHAESLPFAQLTDSGQPIGGLLGYDFIRDAVWHLNYQAGSLEALPPGAFVPPPSARAFAVRFDDNVPILSIGIDGQTAAAFVLDTGAYRCAMFSRYLAVHQKEFADRGLGQAMTDAFPFINEFVGVGGTVQYQPLEVGPFSVGAWSFPTWLFEVTENAPSFEFEDYDGLIGQDFLRNFDVYLDYPHQKVYLVPNDRFKERWPNG
jgi:hypothetical protein